MRAQPKAKTRKDWYFDEYAKIITMNEHLKSKRRDKREHINGY